MDDLLNDLRRLAALTPQQAGPHVEEKLRAAFRARQRGRYLRWTFAAAVVCLAVGIAFLAPRKTAPPPEALYYLAPGFVALPYAESGVPMETAIVLRVRLHPSDLISMGVAVPAAASTATFEADVLVGQDGVARAVRLLQ